MVSLGGEKKIVSESVWSTLNTSASAYIDTMDHTKPIDPGAGIMTVSHPSTPDLTDIG